MRLSKENNLMPSFYLNMMHFVCKIVSKLTIYYRFLAIVFIITLSGCGGGGGGGQSFTASSGINASVVSASESSSGVVSSISGSQSSIASVNSSSSNSSVMSNSSSQISKSATSSGGISSSLNSNTNTSSSSLQSSFAAASQSFSAIASSVSSTNTQSSAQYSSSLNSSNSSVISSSSNSSSSSINLSSSKSLSSSISSSSSKSSSSPISSSSSKSSSSSISANSSIGSSSSSQANSSFALSDINFQLQSPVNSINDSANPVFSISNVDVGDSVVIFSTSQCNAISEFGSGVAVSNSLSLPLAKPLSFGVYEFYISVKESGQTSSSCLPLSVSYTYIPSVSAYINVKDYGAKGDGINDDTQEINAAFIAAKSAGKSIYFPAGTYVCDEKSSPDNKTLIFNAGGLNSIALFGDGDSSHITSSISTKVTLLYIYAYAKSADVHIFNLKLSSTHSSAPAEYQYGLFLQGTGGQNFSNVKVANTTFSGFGGALQGQGINGLEIDHNTFLSPRGHDESRFGSAPAVYIWLFENANGLCENVKIHHNFADGFSGSVNINSTVSKRAMDGFFVGYAYGMELYENTTQNFIEEHYIFTFPVMIPSTQAAINIHDNFMNAAIKPGSMLDNGSAKKSNYGIRSDASHVTIENNTIVDYTLGILVRTIDDPLIAAKNIIIKNNHLSSASDSNTYTMSSAIYVVGNSTYPVDNLDISHNVITMNISPALQVYSAFLISNAANSNIHDNEIKQGFVNFSSNQLIGRNYSKVTNIVDSNNSVTGADILPFKKLAGDTISFQ
jgi:hypothetical protein